MKRAFTVLAIGVFAASVAAVRNSAPLHAALNNAVPAQAEKSGTDLAAGTKIDVTLASSLDAKKNKPGDRVEARTAQDIKQDDKVLLKKGTSLLGHVTQAQARTKDQPQSLLAIVFDHAVLKGGEQMSLPVIIQALGVQRSSTTSDAGSSSVLESGGGFSGASNAEYGGGPIGSGDTSGPAVRTSSSDARGAVETSPGAVGGFTSEGRLAPNSSGVFGLRGLLIDLSASNATEGSVITSTASNVHLDSGTQMLLSVAGQTQ